MMLPAKPSYVLPLSFALIAALVAHAPALDAKTRNTIGTIIGVGAAGALLNEAAKAMGQKPTRPAPSSPGGASAPEAGKRTEDPDAAGLAARQLAAIEENAEIERAKKMELERNVDLAIKAFIDKLIEWHNAINTGDRVRST